MNWKNQYYKDKVHFSIDDEDKLRDMTENYLEGLQWVLYYYYRGIASWPWYYRYHYAPRISDVAKGLNVKINFELGKPFRPFEQLMGVLPARSRALIPPCYRELMVDPKSPIIDFYPSDCDIDMNGKTAPWEAVVLLSFVDQKRLIEAMAPYESKLTPEEKKRNSFGKDLIFHYNPQVKKMISSPIPTAFSDFESHTIEDVFELPKTEGVTFRGGLCEGAKVGKELLAGFPTLKTLPFKAHMEYAALVVFQQPARSTSLILTIRNMYAGLTVEQFAKEYAGELVYVNWPFLQEAKVMYVTDNLMKYERTKFGNTTKVVSSPLENFEIDEFNKKRKEIYKRMLIKEG
ncbi:unnamed protein product [Ambrosiozyma monospora]|uniref:Unnamed protein product n=1 Tax=Ambrosiozyma monospora TaxID=43982 RepID=A0ACB5TMH2_AMBMO|nr:unnamed protein product [Ambrosiozyma monospora]